MVLAFFTAAETSVQADARHDIDMNLGVVAGGCHSEDAAETWEEKGACGQTSCGLGCTFYFNPIRDDEAPNDLKVFLQHPSEIFIHISGGNYEGDSDIEF